MMGLILRYVPVILNQASETAAAQKARAVENRKNSVYRLTKFGFPFYYACDHPQLHDLSLGK
jgi:energy-coupling factor transporter transmembrane protein EcfT